MSKSHEDFERMREKRAQEYKAATTVEKKAKAQAEYDHYAEFRGTWNQFSKRRTPYHLKKWAADIKWEKEYREGMDTTLNGQQFSNPEGTQRGDITMRQLLEPSRDQPGARLEPKNPRVDWHWWMPTWGPAPSDKARILERHGQPWPLNYDLGLKTAADTSKPGSKQAALGNEDIKRNISSFL